ncbi:hypothetical protein LCGC14_1012730 [marine sediment metagenome]|uniref:Uncharacterized protein n=1 Tax=marine sediment metagenome TaxID=412755 RepID=A0A0F9N497_9ZZZZ
MIVIQTKRNKGKTARLVGLLLSDPKALLLVCTEREASRIRNQVCSRNPKEWEHRIMSWGRYFCRSTPTDAHILIDNVDLFLQEKFIFQIKAVSINED